MTLMELPGPLEATRFRARPNQYVVELERRGSVIRAHLPDPGRLKELLLPGAEVWAHHDPRPGRKTAWTAVLVRAPGDGGLVSFLTALPNKLVAEALREGALPELAGWPEVRVEAPHGRSRIDFLLSDGDRRHFVEVKSVTLVENGRGLFPDAVSARAARHLDELAAVAAKPRQEASVLFVCQHGDARSVEPAAHIDPGFARAWAEARAAGVRLLARRCEVTLRALLLREPLPCLDAR